MTKKIVLASLASLFLLSLFILADGEGESPTYVGVKKCLCHRIQYKSWQETTHATGFDKLTDEEKGKKECLECHVTGGSAEMPGVQCESCHGPGSLYKSMKVMKDRELAIKNGLVISSKEVCLKCHDKENSAFCCNKKHENTPTFKGLFNSRRW